MPSAKSEIRSQLVSTYYDTPALALHRERLSLRVRKQGGEFVQTVKAEDTAQILIHESSRSFVQPGLIPNPSNCDSLTIPKSVSL
jgi:hypothetical protein